MGKRCSCCGAKSRDVSLASTRAASKRRGQCAIETAPPLLCPPHTSLSHPLALFTEIKNDFDARFLFLPPVPSITSSARYFSRLRVKERDSTCRRGELDIFSGPGKLITFLLYILRQACRHSRANKREGERLRFHLSGRVSRRRQTRIRGIRLRLKLTLLHDAVTHARNIEEDFVRKTKARSAHD